ncbi:MAG: hypothetical protein PHU23_01170 [Dehalococcoidales bacterium]|nr:hypothetical protein [Dehalococcoidales bacterium]
MGINWWAAASYLIAKIPLEKIFSQEKDKSDSLQELKTIVDTLPKPAKTEVKADPSSTSTVTTRETVDYQNREIGKVLIQMERHAAQGMRIAGKACDCLSKHIVDLESLCEETITMVTNPNIYYRMIDWVRDITPKVSVEANESGQYRDEYPVMARQARDFRKEILGTLDYKALFQQGESPVIQEAENILKQHKEKVTELEVPAELTREPVAKPMENITDNITQKVQNEAESNEEAEVQPEILEEPPKLCENGTVCLDLKPMVEWVNTEDKEKCRTCMLTVTVPWYFEELEERGEKELAEDLEKLQKEGEPVNVAAALDQIKEQVPGDLKQRLLEFDCATQSLEL